MCRPWAGAGPAQGVQGIATATDLSDHRVNERIRAREVRLIDPEGKQLGVKALPEALSVARQLDLDLVEVAPDANPPVCRIMDYNRFKYETAQRAKESKKKATNTSIKEMKYRPKIGTGDFTTKTRQVKAFLEEGHKVKVTIMFRGREVSHPELGMKILEDLAEQVSSVAKVEASPKLDGRNMTMVLAPDRRARQAATRRPGAPTEDQVPTPSSDGAVGSGDGAGPVGRANGPVPSRPVGSVPAPASTPAPESGAASESPLDGQGGQAPAAASGGQPGQAPLRQAPAAQAGPGPAGGGYAGAGQASPGQASAGQVVPVNDGPDRDGAQPAASVQVGTTTR